MDYVLIACLKPCGEDDAPSFLNLPAKPPAPLPAFHADVPFSLEEQPRYQPLVGLANIYHEDRAQPSYVRSNE